MSDHVWTPKSTLGDIEEALKPLKAGGMTRDSMLFVIDKVWYEAAQEEAELIRAARDLINPPAGVDDVEHRMVPGSHERPSGPECLCGAPWDYWDDYICTTQNALETEMDQDK